MASLLHALHDGSMFTLCASVLCLYDHIITFGEEVRCIWQRRISCATVLFAVNRYGVLAMAAASGVSVVSVGLDYVRICSMAVPVTDTFAIIVGIAYAVFAALRIYALYDMNKRVFAAVLAIGLASPLAQLFYACVQSIGVVRSQVSVGDLGGRAYCYQVVQTARAQEIYGTALQRALAYIVPAIRIHTLIFELMLIALMWKKTACRWSVQTSVFRMPFTMIFLRDGTLYFAVIAVGSFLNMLGGIIILQYSTTSPSNSTYRLMLAFLSAGPIVDVLTSICMSRFILDLVAITLDRDESGSSSPWSAVRFASVAESIVGTFGADVVDEGNEGGFLQTSRIGCVDRNEPNATPSAYDCC